MNGLTTRGVLQSGFTAGKLQVFAGILAFVLSILLLAVCSAGTAYAGIHVVDSSSTTAAQAAGNAADDEPAASDDADEAEAEGVTASGKEADESEAAAEAKEAATSDAADAGEDDEAEMYSGEPGDPAHIIRIAIIVGILAVVGIYLILTGRLNRNISAMERRI